MSPNNGTKRLKAALLFSIVVHVFYGIGFFVIPGILRDLAGGTPVELGWIRWAGGMMLSLAVGGIQAYRNPAHQSSMITTLTVAPLLVGLGLLYPLLFENYSIHAWFIAVPCVIAFAVFVVMMWARQGAKEILK
jgi:hypothetical protein